MAVKRPFLKQKPRLYFDENLPEEVIRHFCGSSYWKKKIKGVSSTSCGNSGRSDRFYYLYSQRHRYTLVTLDSDFNNDRLYPFTNGEMRGIDHNLR
jgi:predicted nuclease of predicted toxin-antitoxin system